MYNYYGLKMKELEMREKIRLILFLENSKLMSDFYFIFAVM